MNYLDLETMVQLILASKILIGTCRIALKNYPVVQKVLSLKARILKQ